MLNLDTHMLVYLLMGELTGREEDLVLRHELAISDIVLWEVAKLGQLGRLALDPQSREFRSCLANCTIIPVSLEVALLKYAARLLGGSGR